MWRIRPRDLIGLAVYTFLVGDPTQGHAPTRHHQIIHTPIAKTSHRDGRDIVFSARCYRRSGLFYNSYSNTYSAHGAPADESLEEVCQSVYSVRPDGTGLRRLTALSLVCETPHWSPDGRTIAFVGSTPRSYRHIYSVDSDGSHLVRLTDGDTEDKSPQWSPDGRSILFDRLTDGAEQLCTLAVLSLRSPSRWTLRSLWTDRSDSKDSYVAAWSPDGRWVSVVTAGANDDPPHDLHLVDTTCPPTDNCRDIPHISDAVWSSDGSRLYLRGSDDADHIVIVKSGATARVPDPVAHPAWVDSNHILGDRWRPQASSAYATGKIRIIGRMGQLSHERNLVLGCGFFPGDGDERHVWIPLSKHSKWTLLEGMHGMSDGHHYRCYRVNLRTGVFHLIRRRRFLGFSPDGSKFLAADDNWVGPYKRGGLRVGTLEVVNVATGKARAVSSNRSVIGDAGWRRTEGGSVSEAYAASNPTQYVIDKDGKIAAGTVGYEEGGHFLETALAKLGVRVAAPETKTASIR